MKALRVIRVFQVVSKHPETIGLKVSDRISPAPFHLVDFSVTSFRSPHSSGSRIIVSMLKSLSSIRSLVPSSISEVLVPDWSTSPLSRAYCLTARCRLYLTKPDWLPTHSWLSSVFAVCSPFLRSPQLPRLWKERNEMRKKT